MQGVNKAIFDFCMQHSDDPAATAKGLPPRDPEEYEWLKNALAEIKSDYERMENCIKIITDEKITDIESKTVAMEEMLYYVEDLDNATDFCKNMKGTQTILPLLSASHSNLREGAARIIGTCCQNNIISQGIFLTDKALPILTGQINKETVPNVRTSLLFALSSLIRGNASLVVAFFRDDFALEAVESVVKKHSSDTRSVKKALFFLTALWREGGASDAGASIPADNEFLSVLKSLLEKKEDDVEDIVVQYLIELIKNGKKPSLASAGIEAKLIQNDEYKRDFVSALESQ